MVGKHLKNKVEKRAPESVLEFIEDADNVVESKESEVKPSEDSILLSFSGRIDRGNDCDKKGFLLYLKKDTSIDIAKHCHGSMQGILNYLVRRGLDSLMDEGELKLIME